MHETRNFVVVIVLLLAVVWAVVAWFVLGAETGLIWPQRITSLGLIALSAGVLCYAFLLEDKLPDHLKETLGEEYYFDVDGLSFMPIVRANGERAELYLYYQNRFENPVQAIVHMRPPEESFVIRPGMRDVHFAFKAAGGDFGVIHQPIAVPRVLQGQVVDVELAAATHYPRAQGSRLRRRGGMACGSLVVDWAGAAFKSGVHEVSGEMNLIKPAVLHLSMPAGVSENPAGEGVWKQERIAAGEAS